VRRIPAGDIYYPGGIAMRSLLTLRKSAAAGPARQPFAARIAAGIIAATLLVAAGTVASAPLTASAANPGTCVARSGQAPLCTVSYGYTGGEQTMSIPAGVSSITVTATGARGGNAMNFNYAGGGASATSTVSVQGGSTLYIEVGGTGQDASGNVANAAGGWNGGGNASFGSGQAGGGGGGASDVRTSSRTNAGSLNTRLVVGAGGGGAGNYDDGGGAGQNGVGTQYQAGAGGRAGTGSAGGAGGNGGSIGGGGNGSLGQGGDGPQHGGGGGGGLYGGGGGTVGAGGGGGSSLGASVSGASGGAAVTIQYAAPVAALVISGDTSVVAGTTHNYSATAYDESRAFSWNVTSSTSFGSTRGGSIAGNSDGISGNSVRFGSATSLSITGSTAGVSGSLGVNVVGGSLASLVVTPANSSVTAGGSVTFTASGRDSQGSNLGTISGSTYTTTDAADSVNGSSIRFSKSGTRTVTAASGTARGSTTITVNAGALTSISIDPMSATVVAGNSRTFTTTGRDGEGNSLGSVTSATTFTTTDARASVTGNSVRFITTGATTVTATSGAYSAVANISVSAAAVATIVVGSVTDPVADTSRNFVAFGFDQFGNALGDVSSSAVFSSSRSSVDVVTGSSVHFGLAGARTISAKIGAVTGTTTLTVTPGALARLELTPSDSRVVAGASSEFSVSGFDSAGSPLGVISSGTTYASSDSSDRVTDSSIRFSKAGARTITATNGTATGSTSVVVRAGALASISIDPANGSAIAGELLTFATTGYDAEGNSLGDYTAASVLTSTDSAAEITGASIVVRTAQITTVTATVGQFTDEGTVLVLPDALASIVIAPVTDPVIADTSVPFTASGFDRFGNARGDVTATAVFESSEPALDDVTGPSVHFGMAGDRTITATIGRVAGTLDVAVEPGALDSLVIAPADSTVTAGDSITFVSTGFDSAGSNLGVITTGNSYASVDAVSAETGDTVADASIRFSKVGIRTITVTNGTAEGTTTVEVTAGALASVAIDPASAGAIAGDTLSFATEGFDAEGNSLGDYTSSATLTSTDTAAEITADTVRVKTAATTTVTTETGGFTASATIDVSPSALASLEITPVTDDIVAGTTQQFVVIGYDAFGNSLGDLAAGVDFTTSPALAAGETTFTQAGTYTVTATVNGISTTTTVTVVPNIASPAVVTVTPSASSVKLGGSITLQVTGEDAYGNPVGDLTDRATFESDWDVDQIEGSTVTFPHASVHTITATVEGVSSSVEITVIEPVSAGLAATGMDPLGPSLMSLGALLLGAGALLVARRRRLLLND